MDVATFLYVIIFIELEYTWCDKSMALLCDLQMGMLLWVCTLCFNLRYRLLFNPQSQAFALHIVKYLFHLLDYYVSQKKVRSSKKLDRMQSLHRGSGGGAFQGGVGLVSFCALILGQA